MIKDIFFACPNCGNSSKFKIFTSNFQIVAQSPELGIRTGQSSILPNLRKTDNFVECQMCFTKLEHEVAVDTGKAYIKSIARPESSRIMASARSI